MPSYGSNQRNKLDKTIRDIKEGPHSVTIDDYDSIYVYGLTVRDWIVELRSLAESILPRDIVKRLSEINVDVDPNDLTSTSEAMAQLRALVPILEDALAAIDRGSRSPHLGGVFPDQELRNLNIERLPIDPQVVTIVKERLQEIEITMDNGAYLSVVLLCGSILEAALVGAAQQDPSNFNKAKATPKAKDGSPKKFSDWHLAQLIDVATEINLLGPDVKQFSHGLRGFRNYIHPSQQLSSGFSPDRHTATLCIQALTTALAELTDNR